MTAFYAGRPLSRITKGQNNSPYSPPLRRFFCYKPFYTNGKLEDGEANRKVINLVAKEPPQGGTVGGVVLTFGNPGEWPTRVEGGQDDDDLSSLDYYYLKLKVHDVQKIIKRIEFGGNASMFGKMARFRWQ